MQIQKCDYDYDRSMCDYIFCFRIYMHYIVGHAHLQRKKKNISDLKTKKSAAFHMNEGD